MYSLSRNRRHLRRTCNERGIGIKLLIVDDENLTRTGLMNTIDWMDLGIDQVYTAVDGTDGLRMASAHHPDIVLSDVRMPRMDGIEMMNRIHAAAPDTVFIFMSGYSDKEYLKAAIRLQAVSYVEKPLNLDEVRRTVLEAVERSDSIRRSRSAETLSDSVQAAHLAACLTVPYRSIKESVTELSQNYCRKYGSADLFHAAFTMLLQCDERKELPPDFLQKTTQLLHDRIRPAHMHVISTEKRPNLFVFHVFRKDDFSTTTIRSAADALSQLVPEDYPYFIAAGSIVSGIQKLYASYSSAVVLLQHCFFREAGTVLISGIPDDGSHVSGGEEKIQHEAEALEDALRNADRQAAKASCDSLYDTLFLNEDLMERSVQTFYYRIAAFIEDLRRKKQLQDHVSDGGDILENFRSCFTFPELHQLLTAYVNRYLDDVENYVPENSSVYLIRSYIGSHYDDPLLSTKEIAEYARLSASYACTVFKSETGQTLNQYLTEFRMERAKELLSDPRNNISEVAARVGYNDSNYFGKAFKKYTGFSPSDYRENRTRIS